MEKMIWIFLCGLGLKNTIRLDQKTFEAFATYCAYALVLCSRIGHRMGADFINTDYEGKDTDPFTALFHNELWRCTYLYHSIEEVTEMTGLVKVS
jgi:DhnA family fructose-bisphosphate aldolase class Ia